MNADSAEATTSDGGHEPTIQVILFGINLQASYVRQEYRDYENELKKPVSLRDKLLTQQVVPKQPHRKSLYARWVVFDENVIVGKDGLLEEALKGTENMIVIAGGDEMPWIGMNTHNTTDGPRRLIRSAITLPQMVFNDLCTNLGNFPNASVILHLKVALNNKGTANPLLPNNWFKVDGQEDEADFVMMVVEQVDISPPFEHIEVVEHFMEATSKIQKKAWGR